MKLIDADKVKFYYGGLAKIGPFDFEGISKYFFDQLENEPTMDAVDVTICKDCFHFHIKNIKSMTGYCTIGNIHDSRFSEDYCSRGVRKEEK